MKNDRDIHIISVIILQTLIMVIMITVIRESDDINPIKLALPFFELIVVVLAILNIALIKDIENNAQEKIKNNLMKSHLQQIETMLEVFRSEKHEYNRHLQTLQALIYINKNTEAILYIEGITQKHMDTELIEFIGCPVISGLINSKANLAKSQGIEFAVSPNGPFPKLNIEPWDLCSVLGNLLDNAIEAALQDKAHPRVGVEFKNDGKKYRIYVHNNGAIINKDVIDSIFEAGFSDKLSPGRGYGLFITKALVERYGGEIICSSADAKTTFQVNLPIEVDET